MIHGKDLILSINDTPVAGATSCDLTIKTDFIAVSSPTEGKWLEYLPTVHEWGISVECLLVNMECFEQLRKAQDEHTKLDVQFYNRQMDVFYKGQAYISQLKTQGAVRGLGSYGVSFQTTGPLLSAERVTIDTSFFNESIDGYNFFWAKSGREYVYFNVANGSIVMRQFLVENRTRFHFNGGGMLFHNQTIAKKDIVDLVKAQDHKTLNELAICVASTYKDGDAVLERGYYTILSNDNSAFGEWFSGWYIEKL